MPEGISFGKETILKGSDTLCACLRGEPPPTLDWNALLPLAERHKVAPLLCERLGAAAPETLRERYRSNVVRNLLLTEQLRKLLAAFEAASVAVLPYRGPTLAALAYGKLGCRVFGDLDFLVRRQELPEAKSILTGLGYESLPNFPPHIEAQRLRTSGELALRHGRLPLVELHTTLVAPIFPFPLDYDGIWQRVQRIELGGAKVATLSDEDTLLMLCVHAAQPKACWSKLAMVCDVAALLQARPSMKWDLLLEEAERTHTRRALFLGLRLAADLLGTELAPPICAMMRVDYKVPSLAEQVRQWLACGRMLTPAEKWRFSLQVRERRRDGWRLCVAKLFTPTEPDWAAFSVPPGWTWLYAFYRPLRLCKETLAGRKILLHPVQNGSSLSTKTR